MILKFNRFISTYLLVYIFTGVRIPPPDGSSCTMDNPCYKILTYRNRETLLRFRYFAFRYLLLKILFCTSIMYRVISKALFPHVGRSENPKPSFVPPQK